MLTLLGKPLRVSDAPVGLHYELPTRDPRTGKVSRYVHVLFPPRRARVVSFEEFNEAATLAGSTSVADVTFSDSPN